jgi:hypothetical protein
MQVRECAEDFVGAQEGQSWQKQAAGETLDSDSRGPRTTVTVPLVSGLRSKVFTAQSILRPKPHRRT